MAKTPGPRLHTGSLALLFDRLEDEQPAQAQEARPLRVLDRGELRQSVYREINRLLNSRAALSQTALAARERSVIDYGIPDLVSLNPRDSHDRTQLTLDIKRALEIFEPRLRDVEVRLENSTASHNSLRVEVEGNLIVHNVREAVSFHFSKSGDAWSQQTDADG